MQHLISELQETYKKEAVVLVRSGDTVKVTQRIKEANRERLQVFEGLVLRVRRRRSLTYSILVRKIASGVAVEKSFFLHAPNVVGVEIVKRAKVRRNYLSYMRGRVGKAARLKPVDFDKKAVNEVLATKAQPAASVEKAESVPSDSAEAVQPATEKEDSEKPAQEAVVDEPKVETADRPKEAEKEEAPSGADQETEAKSQPDDQKQEASSDQKPADKEPDKVADRKSQADDQKSDPDKKPPSDKQAEDSKPTKDDA